MQYSRVTWASRRLRSPETRLFFQLFIQPNDQEAIKYCLYFVRGLYWSSVDSLHKRPAMRRVFPCHDITMETLICICSSHVTYVTPSSSACSSLQRKLHTRTLSILQSGSWYPPVLYFHLKDKTSINSSEHYENHGISTCHLCIMIYSHDRYKHLLLMPLLFSCTQLNRGSSHFEWRIRRGIPICI